MKALCFLVAAGVAFAQGPVTVVKQAAPDKALIFEVTLPASRAAVWKVFTTSEGLSTWLTPGAVVDLRKSGEAMAPEQFPTVRAERTNARFDWAKEWGGANR
jgi:uncharacterized protein YndB with AHSA1/START domain